MSTTSDCTTDQKECQVKAFSLYLIRTLQDAAKRTRQESEIKNIFAEGYLSVANQMDKITEEFFKDQDRLANEKNSADTPSETAVESTEGK